MSKGIGEKSQAKKLSSNLHMGPDWLWRAPRGVVFPLVVHRVHPRKYPILWAPKWILKSSRVCGDIRGGETIINQKLEPLHEPLGNSWETWRLIKLVIVKKGFKGFQIKPMLKDHTSTMDRFLDGLWRTLCGGSTNFFY